MYEEDQENEAELIEKGGGWGRMGRTLEHKKAQNADYHG